MGALIDLTGQRFGRLTVIERAETTRHGDIRWLCKCDCGNNTTVFGSNLRKNHTSSCGCVHCESIRTHGESKTRLYRIWMLMKRRCYNPKDSRYNRYGARGIEVCHEWLERFETFRDWSLENGYHDDLTLDRKNNDGNYTPENCRWSTTKEQQNNTSRNRLITFNCETLTIPQWEERTGIKQCTIRSRIRRNWSVERTLTTR